MSFGPFKMLNGYEDTLQDLKGNGTVMYSKPSSNSHHIELFRPKSSITSIHSAKVSDIVPFLLLATSRSNSFHAAQSGSIAVFGET